MTLLARLAAIIVVASLAVACSSPSETPRESGDAPTTKSVSSTGIDVTATLSTLTIDDGPFPGVPYDRGAWPHWDDTDGDGCDARQQALAAASTTQAQVDPYGCQVVAGDWVSAYDGALISDPGELDVDHIVPLENAHNSGGWTWTVERRRQFANDQANLWPVSAGSNRAKGSKTPDQWRPDRVEVWCTYATRWVDVKVGYGLTATTGERDALGQMLDTCDAAAPSTTTTSVATAPPSTTATMPGPPAGAYRNCAEARSAGAAPVREGDAGYGPHLDGDGDGVGCE